MEGLDIFSVFKLLGGLGLFLFGMSIMGSSLERFAGGKLERMLERFTSNPLKGILLGLVVTGIIQSSSATTVMTVGFVNSGIMRLSQAIGIIMGSNIGTTVTAWILSLTGIEGSNFFLMMLQPKNFSLIFAAIGAVLYVFSKSERKNLVGMIMIGFTVLIYGMDIMSQAVVPLRTDPNFARLLVMFTNPIMGVLLGTVVTAIVQSSSASVGILQALAVTGSVTYASAIPIILGQNIGTCVTALLSSIGAKPEAKRVAFVHLYFNVIGTVIFLVIVYSAKAIMNFSFWNSAVTAVDIALIHSIFNIFCTLIFLPFTNLLAKLATMTVKDKKTAEDMIPGVSLDTRFLSSPGFALEQCKNTVAHLCGIIQETILVPKRALHGFTSDMLTQIAQPEQLTNRIADRLNAYILELTKLPLSMQESLYVSKLLHSVRNLERIAEYAKKLVQTLGEVSVKHVTFSDSAMEELDRLFDAVVELVDRTLDTCARDDAAAAEEMYPLVEVVHMMCYNDRESHIERVMAGGCSTQTGMYFDELLQICEQIADRASAILIRVMALKDERYLSQEYLESLHVESDDRFRQQCEALKGKYLRDPSAA